LTIKDEIFIDVGPHKTGTTFRQKFLYPYIDEINYLGHRINIELIIFKDFNKKNKKILISNENLSDWSYLPNHNAVKERNNAIKNIKKLFPNANIIICKRKRNKWIKSLYKQYIWSGGILSYKNWLNSMESNVFDLDDYIRVLKSNFDNVCVLNYNDMNENMEAFTKNLFDFFKVKPINYENRKVNVSLSDKKVKILRIFNHIFKTHENKYGLPFFRHWRYFLYEISTKDK